MNLFIQWLIQPKNAIIILLLTILLGISGYTLYQSNIITKKDKEIAILNNTINDFKVSIEIQNKAITNMNNEYNKQITDYKLKVEKIKKDNKKDLEYIKKQETYKRPSGMSVCDATKKVLNDFIDNRDKE